MDYGFGAVFGCPGHDKEIDFAKKYNLSIKTVVKPKDVENFEVMTEAFSGEGIMINSEFLDGLEAPGQSVLKAIEILQNRKLGKEKINFRLKDLSVSRQRYWDVPYQLHMMKMEIKTIPR